MQEAYIDSTIEALILASPDPLPSRKISQVLEGVTQSRVSHAVSALNERYADSGISFRIREIAGGYQFYILPEYVGYVEDLFARRRKLRLTRAALETLAIVAYKQPVTKTEVEHIRGVASDGVLKTVLEKNLVTVTGRADTLGKPLQYGTTDEFLKFFGLARLDDLPKMNEIEELISDVEQKNQTELELEIGDDGKALKLNVADGTFDPERRERLEEDYEDSGETTPATSEESVDDLVDELDDDLDEEHEESVQEAELQSDPSDEVADVSLEQVTDGDVESEDDGENDDDTDGETGLADEAVVESDDSQQEAESTHRVILQRNADDEEQDEQRVSDDQVKNRLSGIVSVDEDRVSKPTD